MDLHTVRLSSDRFSEEELNQIEQQYDTEGTYCYRDEEGLHFTLDEEELERLRERANDVKVNQ